MTEPNETIDCSGMNCPLPVLKTKLKIDSMAPGEILRVTTTDPGSCKDMPAWADRVGHKIIESSEGEGKFYFLVRKGE